VPPIVITASTELELAWLTRELGAVPFAGLGRLAAWHAESPAGELVLAVTGIGKVNAALAGAVLLERLAPRLVVNTGCGGACAGSGLAVGDLAIASEECFPEEGVLTPEGWRGLDLIGIPVLERGGVRIFNQVPLDRQLAEGALSLAESLGFRARLGPFHTVSTCSGTALRGAELLGRYPGICENMEGAALAQAAFGYDTPFLEVRGISNLVEDRDLTRWDLKRAVSEAQRFLLAYLQVSSLPSSYS